LNTYRIHIKGIVQGVGFRPLVVRLAKSMQINGQVSNSTNGVIIEMIGNKEDAIYFYERILSNPPENAVITDHSIHQISNKIFDGFCIQQSLDDVHPDLLLTPDIAICDDCKKEIVAVNDKRYGYAFTTCLNCGPRYSITSALPYDRTNTTMNYLDMCSSCLEEYNNIDNKRYFSQTNSCFACEIKMHLYYSTKEEHHCSEEGKLNHIVNVLNAGLIVAVKGMGGYLLVCDATNHFTIEALRARKNRPSKPLAVLYTNTKMAAADVILRSCEIDALESKIAPIVLCKTKPTSGNNICKEFIAPGLDKIGVMIAYTPLLYLLSVHFGKPLIATSANISGAPIIYNDQEAITQLFNVADLILSYERDILIPQDDSVLQFTEQAEQIVLRRSRGLAPNYFPNPFHDLRTSILAAGGELKSAFALFDRKNLFVSQFLGDQGVIESQEHYTATLQHLLKLTQTKPETILIDAHPDYFVSKNMKGLNKEFNYSKTISIQHHKAHFGAVLAENKLLDFPLPVLGVIWDGTGYGEDNRIWGSEFFVFQHQTMQRVAHLKYFPQLAGDKMSKEPRLSALSLLHNFPAYLPIVESYFSSVEWNYFQKLLQQEQQVNSSSMGRFIDALACILGVKCKHSYEGEAAMLLEALARSASIFSNEHYTMTFENDELNWEPFVEQFMTDVNNGLPTADIAWKIFYSLSKVIEHVAECLHIPHIAFSGGVFQNAVLVDVLKHELSVASTLYFNRQLSPNDECIGFGQIACYAIEQQKQLHTKINKEIFTHSFA